MSPRPFLKIATTDTDRVVCPPSWPTSHALNSFLHVIASSCSNHMLAQVWSLDGSAQPLGLPFYAIPQPEEQWCGGGAGAGP
ncbi:hypothetical protein HaLaN_23743 [Haematococcus lacustris]|uniref:Uncharacterized protein n=1 Tax=Haematococcus lacustris TaxID=44745 RepID=A0A6A0A202_HAELA|nr:hypothetical protein HaLaN_23743 [Haematococcus lacustris]